MRPGHGSITHLPALDGLRGLAVAVVVWFHLGGRIGPLVKGGYLGVDLFFVLSGYLITSVLLAEYKRSQRIDLGAFWVRRARRLLPALLSLMPAIALYARFVAKWDEVLPLRKDALATLAYVANWRAIFSEKSYWDLFAAPSPLEHTWSLAIEEQFYVVWPLLFVLAVVRLKLTKPMLVTLSLGLAALSAFAMVALFDPAKTARAYFGTDTRAASILLGAALSFAINGRSLERVARALDVVGALCIVFLGLAWTRLEGQNPLLYRGGFLAAELACLVLIACATLGKSSYVARALSFAPFTWLGKISYGIYLWHWPIFCVLSLERLHVSEGALTIIRLALTLAIAIVSYRFFEEPIRRHGLGLAKFGIKRPLFAVVLAVVAVVAVIAVCTRPKATPRAALPFPVGQAIPANPGTNKVYPTPYSVAMSVLPEAKDLPPNTPRILTLGDSVAQKLAVALRIHQESAHVFVADRGVGDCSIMQSLKLVRGAQLGHPNPKSGCAANWAQDVAELRPDITFLVIGGGFFADLTIDGARETACGHGWQEVYRARYEQLLDAMGANAGKVVVALAPYPGSRWIHGTVLADVDCFNGLLRAIARAHGLQTVDIAAHVCPTRDCTLLADGEPIRPDGLHPECPGANELAHWTLGELTKGAAEPK